MATIKGELRRDEEVRSGAGPGGSRKSSRSSLLGTVISGGGGGGSIRMHKFSALSRQSSVGTGIGNIAAIKEAK